ncbi:hypothetical protein OAU50_02840 [Planctomycetota bacterium]|nr:hypothetical protein [Planctomycetota bacterium]
MGVYQQNVSAAADCEVKGPGIISVQQAVLIKSVGREISARHGLAEIDNERWYPMQNVLNIYRDIREELGEESLYSIGRRIPYVVGKDPALLRNVESALVGLNTAYTTVNRGSDIGSYDFEKLGPDRFRLVCNTPYDHTLDHGIIVSFVEKAKGRQVWNVELLPMETSPHENNRGVFEITRV